MPAVLVDLSISCRWILPMTSRGVLLENHTLLVRDGRILDVLPHAAAAARYTATVHVDRSEHLLMPGLVNAHAQILPDIAAGASPERWRDSALLGIAALLQTGSTCFCAVGHFPDETARAAVAQGVRALIGLPIAEAAGPWAKNADGYLARAVELRDEFSGHPAIATAFAPLAAAAMSDATFSRVATLVNELDTGILLSLHESAAEIQDCVAGHGQRPIERLQTLGLLTPALTATHMVHVDAADVALAQRGGIAIALCPQSNLRSGVGRPPVTTWMQSGLRLGLGTGLGEYGTALDLWSELKLLTLLARESNPIAVRNPGAAALSGIADAAAVSSTGSTAAGANAAGTGGAAAGSSAAGAAGFSAWDALALATRGGAAALGLDAEIGTLERGKWADLCCVTLHSAAMLRAEGAAATRLLWSGGRDIVTDVWVAGRHLLNGGSFTRLDWPALAARVAAWPSGPLTDDGSSMP